MRVKLAHVFLALLVATMALGPAESARAEYTGYEPHFYLESRLMPGLVLEVAGQSPRVSAPLAVAPWSCGARHQIWIRYDNYLVSKLNGFALSLLDDSTAPGTRVVVDPQDLGRTPDRFPLDANVTATSYGFITEAVTGLALAVQGGGTAPGTPVVAETKKATGAANQKWKLVPYQGCSTGTVASSAIVASGATVTASSISNSVDPSVTHTANGNGTQVIMGNGDPDGRFIAHFTWKSSKWILITEMQFYNMEYPTGSYIEHYATVRYPVPIRRTLPPPSSGMIYDRWSVPPFIAHAMQYAPEELIVEVRQDNNPELGGIAGRVQHVDYESGTNLDYEPGTN